MDVQTQQAGFVFGKATSLPIEGIRRFARTYDITPNGKSFVVILPKPGGSSPGEDPPEADPAKAPPDQINIILNWFEELRQRVPVK